MFRMSSVVSRFCAKCLQNRTGPSGVSPIVACNRAKRYQSSSSRDPPPPKPDDGRLSDDFDFESESPYSKVDYEAIAGGDEDKLRAVKVLQLQVELMRQQGDRVPAHLDTQQWKNLLALDTVALRDRQLRYLWVLEMKKKNRREKSRVKAEKHANYQAEQRQSGQRPLLTTSSPLNYKLAETSIFHRLRDSTMNQFYNHRLMLAEWFGPKILVDCGYERFMMAKNAQSCVKQMLLMWSENRETANPYDLIYCNVNQQGSLWQKFTNIIPMINEPDSPVHFTGKHYLEMFPREKLVYLTPHCAELLEHYSHDDIYIIGAYVDSNQCQPISLAKAKKEKLRMAKLPLDRYLHWAVGHKSLPINQVLAILNDLKDGLPWPAALKHVPRRKIVSHDSDPRDNRARVVRHSTKDIRENYRRNLVYDLFQDDKPDESSKKK